MNPQLPVAALVAATLCGLAAGRWGVLQQVPVLTEADWLWAERTLAKPTLADLRAAGWRVSQPLDPSTELNQGSLLLDPFKVEQGSERWQGFIARLGPGDELVRLSSLAGDSFIDCGWMGYGIVREGIVVTRLMTVMF